MRSWSISPEEPAAWVLAPVVTDTPVVNTVAPFSRPTRVSDPSAKLEAQFAPMK